MKKIAFLFAAVAITAMAQAQLVVGVQGGYFRTSETNNLDTTSVASMNWLAGARVGYMITPKLYVGISGQYNQYRDDAMLPHLQMPYGGRTPDPIVDNHHTVKTQSGWSISPQIRYEFLSYGNMHFHILVQGTVSQLGYTTTVESFYTPFLNNGEYHELDAVQDSVKNFSWGVSARPTLTYEFSRHLSAELSLDFLSVGFAVRNTIEDGHTITNRNGDNEPYTTTDLRIYGGVNTLMQALHWENPMLRLGFNWTF